MLRMRNATTAKPKIPHDVDVDFLWGARAIGAYIGRTEQQVHYLHGRGQLGDAVTKLGHKTLVASRAKLRALLASETS
jgi:hypothetical protein